MTSITFVRHATTEWMEQGRVHGRLDSRLSARGKREAHLAGLSLRRGAFDAFYTSPALRAVETASIIGQEIGTEPVVLDGLRELDFGCLEGKALGLPPGARPSIRFYLRWAVAFPFLVLTGELWPRFTPSDSSPRTQITENGLLAEHGSAEDPASNLDFENKFKLFRLAGEVTLRCPLVLQTSNSPKWR